MSLFKRAPTLVRAAQPIARITETLVLPHHRLRTAKTEVSKTNAVVIDARSATSFDDLTWVHSAAQEFAPSAAFRKPGGRVVVLRREPSALDAAEAAAVSEALVGFAKSLAKETGGRGATVNVLCDASEPSASPTSDWAGYGACAAPLQWLLSNESAYVTGQELTVVREAAPELAEADRTSAVLITGAARGIGRATAQFVCRTQPTRPLVLVDHPSATQTLSSVARDLGSIGAACVAVPLDVTADEAGAAIAAAGSEAGGYGAVIHAAGVTRDKTLANMSADVHWRPVIDVNLRAVATIDAALLATPGALCVHGAGFVSFGSTSGINGNAGQCNYAAAKSGLMGYAAAMGRIEPPHKGGHRFACVAPGFIITEMTEKMPLLTRVVGARLNSLQQGGLPEDVAAAVSFLASAGAAGLKPGSTLRVCGQFWGGR